MHSSIYHYTKQEKSISLRLVQLHILHKYKTTSEYNRLSNGQHAVQTSENANVECKKKKFNIVFRGKKVHENAVIITRQISGKKKSRKEEDTTQLEGSYRISYHTLITFIPQTMALMSLKGPSLRIGYRKNPE